MRYEAVIVSDDSETDYSSTEEEGGASLLALGTPPSQVRLTGIGNGRGEVVVKLQTGNGV